MKKLALAYGPFILLFLTACVDQPDKPKRQVVVAHVPKKIKKQVNKPPHDTISIAAVGDIMLGTSYPNKYSLPPNNAKGSFNAVLSELRDADITFGNLEGTLLDNGSPAAYKKNLAIAYFFKMPTAYVNILKDAGFNVLSLANNHSGDFGPQGRESTTRTLDSAGINYGGLLSHPTAIFKLNGITYGFCAFAPNSNTVPILDLKNAAQIISDLKKQVDIVVVSFHGGGEGAAYEHVPLQDESYLGQKRGNVRAFAHNAIDAGADVVLGNGPHVNRAIECYKNHLIAYSLGNFCTYKSVSVSGVCGLSSLLKIYLDKKGTFLKGRIIALKQTHFSGLQRDSLNTVIGRIQSLTKADFPQSGLNITDDGKIMRVD